MLLIKYQNQTCVILSKIKLVGAAVGIVPVAVGTCVGIKNGASEQKVGKDDGCLDGCCDA